MTTGFPTELDAIEGSLRNATGQRASLIPVSPLGGGDTDRSWRVRFGNTSIFLKLARGEDSARFSAEAASLRAIDASGTFRVPEVIDQGRSGEVAWLALSYIPLDGPPSLSLFGRSLAKMHRVTAGKHGWSGPNWLGGSVQDNRAAGDWPTFWWQRRLQPQFTAALRQGFTSLAPAAEAVEVAVPRWLADHDPTPSLLHGDLWAGNHGYDRSGRPVVFDPAVYHGDRETDLAMMALFGGFSAEVCQGYQAEWPLPEGHERRQLLYQLYHLLNHLNLFGGGWLGRVEAAVARLTEG